MLINRELYIRQHFNVDSAVIKIQIEFVSKVFKFNHIQKQNYLLKTQLF